MKTVEEIIEEMRETAKSFRADGAPINVGDWIGASVAKLRREYCEKIVDLEGRVSDLEFEILELERAYE